MFLKDSPSRSVTSSWMCDEAETKAGRCGPAPGGHAVRQLLAGGSMMVPWIKHKRLRVRTGSWRWGLQEVTSVQWLLPWWSEFGSLSSGLKWSWQLSGWDMAWRAEEIFLSHINFRPVNTWRFTGWVQRSERSGPVGFYNFATFSFLTLLHFHTYFKISFTLSNSEILFTWMRQNK